MRRLSFLVMTLVLPVALLAGCSSSDDTATEFTTDVPTTPGDSTSTTSTTSTTPTTSTTEPTPALTILVTNDDGIGAPGIDALVTALSALPDVEIVVVAPAENQSGSSDKTTDGEVTATAGATTSGVAGTAVAGFPADSVIYALDVLGVGKKSALFSKRYGYPLIGVYDDFADKPAFESVRPVARQVIDLFINGAYDTVMVGYTHFGSAVSQQVYLRQILPLSLDAMRAYAEKESIKETELTAEYTFEPSYQAVLDEVVPRLVEVLLYQMVLESSASEHSSRMVAMKNATDNANTLVDTLTLTYNKARQAAITQEISEIVGGAAALE
jgi:hypothetical protein